MKHGTRQVVKHTRGVSSTSLEVRKIVVWPAAFLVTALGFHFQVKKINKNADETAAAAMRSAEERHVLAMGLRSFQTLGLMLEKKAEPSCRISSSVSLCWELEEPKGPKGSEERYAPAMRSAQEDHEERLRTDLEERLFKKL